MKKFPPSLYKDVPVSELDAETLDAALEAGYFPTGGGIKISSYEIFRPGELYPSVELRSPLDHGMFSRSKRKLLRRNGQIFSHEIVEPFRSDAEVDRLWKDFTMSRHGWLNPLGLEYHLFHELDPDRFPGKLLKVWHGQKLVAFSVFFQGKRGMTSLEAAFDLKYHKYSLGFYTMLLELKYGLERGLKYYYPGSLFKDLPIFQYKLRLPALECYDILQKKWIPFSIYNAAPWPFETMCSKLNELNEKIENQTKIAPVGNQNCFMWFFESPSSVVLSHGFTETDATIVNVSPEENPLPLWVRASVIFSKNREAGIVCFFHPLIEGFVMVQYDSALAKMHTCSPQVEKAADFLLSLMEGLRTEKPSI